MLNTIIFKLRHVVMLFLSVWVLSACGGGSSSTGSTTPTNDEPSNEVTVRFQAPAVLKSSKDVDTKKLTPVVNIEGAVVNGFQRSSDGFWSRVKTTVPLSGSVAFVVTWSMQHSNKTLNLGKVETSVDVNSQTTSITIDQSNFATSSFDEDHDGVSNFDELAQNIDPFNAETDLVASSFRIKFTVPDVEYSGDLDIGAVWNGQQILLSNKGLVYEGIERNLTPSEGAVRILIFTVLNGSRTNVYRYDLDKYVVEEGENFLEVSANQFVARPIDAKVTVKIPNRNYRGDYTVTLFDLSQNTDVILSSSSRSYSKTLKGVKRGPKRMAVEIRASGSGVLWARSEKNFTVKAGLNTFSFLESHFSFAFDNDGDGTDNINDSQPNVANIDVNIPYASNGTPTIDGVWDGTPWGAATSIDAAGGSLKINHLMMEQRAQGRLEDSDDAYEKNLQPRHTWSAMYDDSYLYLLVEVIDDNHPKCDSQDPWDDDNLNIYWDGDNSKGDKYDGVNDFHLMIPLYERSSDCLDFNHNGRMRIGVNSASLASSADLHYATGRLDSRTTFYEVKIGLKKAGISSGKVFGFDVHIDDDDDGGDRDQKWGWKHPSRQGSDVDETYKNPKVMGNVILN